MLWISSILLFHCLVNANVLIVDNNNTILHEFISYTSNFGPDLSRNDVEGIPYLANPIEACDNVNPPGILSPIFARVIPHGVTSILLIRRSDSSTACSFETKVFNAQVANYNAAIVFNDHSNSILIMQPSGLYDPTAIKIPSVFIGRQSGDILMKYIQQKNRSSFSVILKREEYKGLKYYLIPLFGVFLLTLFFIVFILILKLIVRYRRERRNRLPKSALQHIPVQRYVMTEEIETCPICLDDYVEGVKVRSLFCGHVYHCKCIDPWLLYNKRTCPVCKRKVLRYPGEQVHDSNSSDEYSSQADDDDGDEYDESESAPLLRNSQEETYHSVDRRQSATSDETAIIMVDGRHYDRRYDDRATDNSDDDETLILSDRPLSRYQQQVHHNNQSKVSGKPSRADSDPVQRVFFIGSADANPSQSDLISDDLIPISITSTQFQPIVSDDEGLIETGQTRKHSRCVDCNDEKEDKQPDSQPSEDDDDPILLQGSRYNV